VSRPALERLVAETQIGIASIGELRAEIEQLGWKIDALDSSLVRENSDLRNQIEDAQAKMDKAVLGLQTELAVSELASDTVAKTGITWLGVLVAVIIGGLIVRACQ
jgi:hypothetical protein